MWHPRNCQIRLNMFLRIVSISSQEINRLGFRSKFKGSQAVANYVESQFNYPEGDTATIILIFDIFWPNTTQQKKLRIVTSDPIYKDQRFREIYMPPAVVINGPTTELTLSKAIIIRHPFILCLIPDTICCLSIPVKRLHWEWDSILMRWSQNLGSNKMKKMIKLPNKYLIRYFLALGKTWEYKLASINKSSRSRLHSITPLRS